VNLGQPPVISNPLEVEEEKMDVDSQSTFDPCPYCRKPIAPSDEQRNDVGMFLATECFHRFHISCFKQYAKK
jgi:hypothetical protein